MIKLKKENKNNIVYDISLDGTFVNALGMNVLKNTDGFNFKMPDTFRYTKEKPYISTGEGRNTVKGKEYSDVDADVAEFEDMYMKKAYNGGTNKMGLGIDEYCQSTINFSRKNYADFLDSGKTKKVGNTIKSRRMSTYIENFLDDGIDLLLKGEGQKFLENYYAYIDKIYNYQIPLRDIASKGKIKKTVEQYKIDCNTLTKSGSKKSRQAWYELVIRDNIKVDLNDTIYYVNCGSKKSESDVKRITHQYIKLDNDIVELNTTTRKELLKRILKVDNVVLKDFKAKELKDMIAPYIVKEEDEIVLNCKIIPNEIIDAEEDIMCNDDIEYNVVKYIEQFNSRIRPLLVCFSPEIRDNIMIQNPDDRKYFTSEQCELVSGQPMKETDQDSFEQLMTPERKEIEYWLSINEIPPFVEECGIDWDKIVCDYKETKRKEEDELFKIEDEKYKDILSKLTSDDIDKFENEGIIPSQLLDLVTVDASTMQFKFINIPTMTPSTGGYIFDDIFIQDNSEVEFEKFIESYHE